MPEASSKKFRYYEMVPKGTGTRTIEQKVTCTARGAVVLMGLMFYSEQFSINNDDCKKNMSPEQQREAFGKTIAEMEREDREFAEATEAAEKAAALAAKTPPPAPKVEEIVVEVKECIPPVYSKPAEDVMREAAGEIRAESPANSADPA